MIVPLVLAIRRGLRTMQGEAWFSISYASLDMRRLAFVFAQAAYVGPLSCTVMRSNAIQNPKSAIQNSLRHHANPEQP
jgi:hypothetical protein